MCSPPYEAGCRAFDASLGGLGGCPYAPGATGNIVMEDTVFMFEAMGCATGIDLDRLAAVRAIVARRAAARDALWRHRQGRSAAQLPPRRAGGGVIRASLDTLELLYGRGR